MDIALLFSVVLGVVVLLLLILRFKFPAFVALLISSIVVGVFAGLSPDAIVQTIQTGMGNTLGFVAIVVGCHWGELVAMIVAVQGGKVARTVVSC